VDSESLESDSTAAQHLQDMDGILVPGGFGERGISGKLAAIRHAREAGVPFLGICLGMQLAVVEFARHKPAFQMRTPRNLLRMRETSWCPCWRVRNMSARKAARCVWVDIRADLQKEPWLGVSTKKPTSQKDIAIVLKSTLPTVRS